MQELPKHRLESIDRRYSQALWYAFGWEDATGQDIDALEFSRMAREEARAFYSEEVSSLDSVADQLKRFLAER